MKLSTCSILLLSFLLAGCKEKLATLEFSSAAVHDGVIVEPASRYSHESQLARELEKLGIERDSLDIERDGKDRSVVHINRRKEAVLNAGQRETLKAYLTGIIQARQQAGFQMSLITKVEDVMNAALKHYFGAVMRSVIFKSSPYYEVRALHPQDHKPYRPGDNAQALLCSADVRLSNPATVSYSSLERIEGVVFDAQATPNMQGGVKVKLPSGADHTVQVPAFLNIENADLRQLLNEGRLQLHFHLEPAERNLNSLLFAEMSVIRTLSFTFATVDVPAGRRTMLTFSQVNRACADKLKALGRPFSFQAGAGLDSLTYVTFWDEA